MTKQVNRYFFLTGQPKLFTNEKMSVKNKHSANFEIIPLKVAERAKLSSEPERKISDAGEHIREYNQITSKH